MDHILVIGYGNPHRSDDGVGFRVAEAFSAQNPDTQTVEVIATQELKPEMVESISRADLVLFIDASVEGQPGTVSVRELKPAESSQGAFSHSLDPGTMLGAARIIYRRCPEAMMISVVGETFGISSRLSPVVEQTLPVIQQKVAGIIHDAKYRAPVLLYK